MQLHELQPKNSFKRKKRVGRGGKKGTYCGVGGKGQKGRAGFRIKPIVREWLKKYPKLRGYNFNVLEAPFVVVDIADLDKNFGTEKNVNPKTLLAKKLISTRNGKLPKVKIMGKGDITKSLIISGCKLSKTAKEKIEKQGGEIKTKKKAEKEKIEKADKKIKSK
ncbi:MAG: uL15 family ribosomal protein [Candidatus Paceibacterota bacterium]|jgi:large subunit ribosomal protein L15